MSEHMGKSMNRPRLCSIRITQEGAGAATANILLEPNAEMERPIDCKTVNIISQQQHYQPQVENGSGHVAIEQQVYTKRSKYLDEELDDTKEVIVCVDNRAKAAASALPTIICGSESPGKVSQALIELNNRTDSEKFRESENNNNKLKGNTFLVEEGEAGGQCAFLMDDPVPVVENLQVMDMTMTTNININANNSINNQNFNNVPKNTSNSLRQEQLDRVAVWVQQSNEQKQQQLHSTGSETTTAVVPGGHLLQRKSANHSELSASNATTVKELNRADAAAIYTGDVCIDIEYDEGTGGAAVVGLDSDIAQMEYNVKKFLLKQNEWSIGAMKTEESGPENHHHKHNHNAAAGYMYSPSSSMSFASLTSNLRTETNL